MPTGKFIQLQIFRYFQFYEFWGFLVVLGFILYLQSAFGQGMWRDIKLRLVVKIQSHIRPRKNLIQGIQCACTQYSIWPYLALSGLCLTHKEPQAIGCAATFNHVSNSNVDVIADIFKNQFLTMLFLTDLILFRLNQDKSCK